MKITKYISLTLLLFISIFTFNQIAFEQDTIDPINSKYYVSLPWTSSMLVSNNQNSKELSKQINSNFKNNNYSESIIMYYNFDKSIISYVGDLSLLNMGGETYLSQSQKNSEILGEDYEYYDVVYETILDIQGLKPFTTGDSYNMIVVMSDSEQESNDINASITNLAQGFDDIELNQVDSYALAANSDLVDNHIKSLKANAIFPLIISLCIFLWTEIRFSVKEISILQLLGMPSSKIISSYGSKLGYELTVSCLISIFLYSLLILINNVYLFSDILFQGLYMKCIVSLVFIVIAILIVCIYIQSIILKFPLSRRLK